MDDVVDSHGRRLESDSCSSSNDGDCDDGGPGYEYQICASGTDCTDCGRSNCAPTASDGVSSDSCAGRNNNGLCEDGIGGAPNYCTYCTDYSDCGARTTSDCNGCTTAPGAVKNTIKAVSQRAPARGKSEEGTGRGRERDKCGEREGQVSGGWREGRREHRLSLRARARAHAYARMPHAEQMHSSTTHCMHTNAHGRPLP